MRRHCGIAAGGGAAARQCAWRGGLLFAQGLHSAHQALPRRLPLLHLCACAARRRAGLSVARRSARRSRAPGAMPAATRRCSRSATSRSFATARRAKSSIVSGMRRTLSYLAEVARLVFDETGLLPHVNPGLLDAADLGALRKVSISQGMMLESTSRAARRAGRAAFRLARQGSGRRGSPPFAWPASSACRSRPAS